MHTEMEARYLVPDRQTFEKLRNLESLAGYEIQARTSARITDHYLDTPGKALLRQGWACRLRSENGVWFLTLKAPKKVQGAIVERAEYQVSLPERIDDVTRWPSGEIREHVLQLTGGSSLRKLVSIQQRRLRFAVLRDTIELAELCLDVVRVSAKGRRHRTYMVECELLEPGTPDDLARLDSTLQAQFRLVPEPRSKLQHALELKRLYKTECTSASHDEVSLEALAQRYDLNQERAQRAARNAQELFHELQPLHGLPDEYERLASTAAWLCDIGRVMHRKRRHLAGRDILLKTPLTGFSSGECRLLAAAVGLHSGEITPARLEKIALEPADERARQEGLRVAALVRLATALGGKGDRTTRIQEVTLTGDGAQLALQGPRAARDAARARRRSDLWSLLLDAPLDWQPPAAKRKSELSAKRVGLKPSDTMREAGRKVLAFHFQAMLRNEKGTREGIDPEALHDMRVAVRRMRSALGIFAPYLVGERVAAVADGLREATRALGAVRDLDVAQDAARTFAETQPEGVASLRCLLDAWSAQRTIHRERMLAYLDGPAFRDIVSNIRRLLADQQAMRGYNEDSRPMSTLAALYLRVEHNIVAAYRPVITRAPIPLLHALRIDCKRLRYSLEFLRELLPPQGKFVVQETITLQDHLGEMHDADVAVAMLDAFLAQWGESEAPTGVMAYRKSCLAKRIERIEALPQAYARFFRPKVQKAFDLVFNKLYGEG